VIIVTDVGREGTAQKIIKRREYLFCMGVPEGAHGSSEFRVKHQPVADSISPPTHGQACGREWFGSQPFFDLQV